MEAATDSGEDVARRIEHARRELLDLSARNRLVSTPRGSSQGRRIEVVDERSEEVFRLLVRERKAMSFLPGVEEDDGRIGEAPRLAQPVEEAVDGGTPDPRQTDPRLQTRLASERLQAWLRDMGFLRRGAGLSPTARTRVAGPEIHEPSLGCILSHDGRESDTGSTCVGRVPDVSSELHGAEDTLGLAEEARGDGLLVPFSPCRVDAGRVVEVRLVSLIDPTGGHLDADLCRTLVSEVVAGHGQEAPLRGPELEDARSVLKAGDSLFVPAGAVEGGGACGGTEIAEGAGEPQQVAQAPGVRSGLGEGAGAEEVAGDARVGRRREAIEHGGAGGAIS